MGGHARHRSAKAEPSGSISVRTSDVSCIIALVATIFAINFGRQLSGDVFWHLKTGEWILKHKAFPFHDPFSYTASQTWILQEWGFQVLAYLVSRISMDLLVWLSFTVVAAGLLVSYVTCRRCASLPTAFLITALVAGVSADMVDVRAQTFGLLLFALLVLLVENSSRQVKGFPIWLPALFLLWANIHSSFTAGLILLGTECVGSLFAIRNKSNVGSTYSKSLRDLGLTIGCVLAALVNPNGYHLYEFPLRTVGHGGMTSMIAEWLSPDFRSLAGASLGLFIIATICGMSTTSQKLGPRHLLRLTVFMAAALVARRLGPFFALACAPAVAGLLTSQIDKILSSRVARKVTAVLVNVMILCGVAFRVSDMRGMSPFDYVTTIEAFPAAACDYILREEPPGPMFNELNYGSYLIWRLWPKYKVFVDNRNDIFYGGAFEEFIRAAMVGGNSAWREVFDRRRINLVIMPPDSLLADILAESDDWNLAFADGKAVVYTRVRPLKP